MKTVQDQIRDLRNTRATKASRMAELSQKSIDDGRSMDSAEAEEFDTLDTEIKALDGDLKRLERLEQLNVERGTDVRASVQGNPSPQRQASEIRGAPAIIVAREADEKFKGQMFTRKIIAKALARLDDVSPIKIAEERWGKSNPQLVEVIRSSVAGGGTGSGEWGAELASSDSRYTGDFISALTEKTVFDQLPLREVPARVHIKGQDGRATGYWTAESKGIKVSKADFSDVELLPLKVAALAVVSNELLRSSSPSAEMLVRDSLVEASGRRVDQTFLSTSGSGTGTPAGILNGVTAWKSGGADAAGVREDILELYKIFMTNLNASGLAYVMNKSLAKGIQLLTNALGQKEFPEINQEGGFLEGDRVYTGDNVGAAHFILLKPSDIFKIGDGGVEVSLSKEATIEMADDPAAASDTPVAQANYPVSMFQTESTAIKVVREVNYAKRRSSAVQYIDDAAYNAPATT